MHNNHNSDVFAVILTPILTIMLIYSFYYISLQIIHVVGIEIRETIKIYKS